MDEPFERLADEPFERIADEPFERIADEPFERIADEPFERITDEPFLGICNSRTAGPAMLVRCAAGTAANVELHFVISLHLNAGLGVLAGNCAARSGVVGEYDAHPTPQPAGG